MPSFFVDGKTFLRYNGNVVIKDGEAMKTDLLEALRQGKTLSLRQQLRLILQLSLPAIMAQLSSIVMQYIDAAMVGRLGAEESAAIGLVASSTWLFGGLCSAAVVGFTVRVAQSIGAGEERRARDIMKLCFVATGILFVLLALAGALISPALPHWLGGSAEICGGATGYFLVYALSLPFVGLNALAAGMLQASGNMKLPGLLHVIMCFLDVVFNFFLIYPTHTVGGVTLPGAGLGLVGASLGTALSQVVIGLILTWFLLCHSPMLRLRKGEKNFFSAGELGRCIRISVPVAVEQVVSCGAHILFTGIVSPLGNVAIAANSFAITAESLCYMPGYGIGRAATTLIGQSVGAGRKDLTNKLGWLTTLLGTAVMGVAGLLLYLAAPWMMALLTPDTRVIALGVQVLRIEAVAEAFYGASIVALGVFQGAGDTLIPSIMNFFSMWVVRLPLAALLAPRYGLAGVWVAMCLELCFRGVIFLVRLAGKGWRKERE